MAAIPWSTASSNSTTLSSLNPDITRTHILTRLDGPSLAALASTSSQFLALSDDEKLWRELCSATWSSADDLRVRQVISSFPGGHRSFFSDSFPVLYHLKTSNHNQDPSSPGPSDLISAVDIHYENKLVFSGVRKTDTTTKKFLLSPFRIELSGSDDAVSAQTMRIEGRREEVLQHLKENLTLSWIVIDPTAKRAANVSTRSAVSLEWPSMAGSGQLCYSTIMAGDGRHRLEAEPVECRLVVKCSAVEEGEVHVDDVSMEVKDIEGKRFDGMESLVILQEALVKGRRKRGKRGEAEEKCKEFEIRKIEKKEKKPSGGGVVDKVCYPVLCCTAFCITVCLSMVVCIPYQVRRSFSSFKSSGQKEELERP